jgi:RecA/RadA recombinase
MSTNKWMQKLQKTMKGALVEPKDRFARVCKTDSPSVNFVYGRTHGLPFGYTTVLYGPPKGGKSVLLHMMIGWLHQSDPDAIAVKIDPEFRSEGQVMTPEAAAAFGIDLDRLLIIQTNSPSEVFDQIEQDIAAYCQAGAPIRLVGIDSISGVQGRRGMNTESVEKQTIGDHAQTIQIGLQRILGVIRKYDIALVLVTQIRAEMDLTEQMRGNKFKMQGSYGLQHFAEYFVAVEPNRTKDGRTNIHGQEFVNEDLTDLAGKSEQTAMKIRVKMKDSSMGPKGRTGEFTFDFKKGVVNQYEEVFKLGTGYGIVDRPNQLTYAFNGEKWSGKDKFVEALKATPQLCKDILDELQRRDLAGEFGAKNRGADEAEDAAE